MRLFGLGQNDAHGSGESENVPGEVAPYPSHCRKLRALHHLPFHPHVAQASDYASLEYQIKDDHRQGAKHRTDHDHSEFRRSCGPAFEEEYFDSHGPHLVRVDGEQGPKECVPVSQEL